MVTMLLYSRFLDVEEKQHSYIFKVLNFSLTVADWMKAVRAMEILGILIIGGAGLCGFLKLFVMKTQDALPKFAAALAIAAGKWRN